VKLFPYLACLLLTLPILRADVPPLCADKLKEAADFLFAEPVEDRAGSAKTFLGAAELMAPCMAQSEDLDKKFLRVIEARRIDKQVGSSSGSAGTTTLVPSGAAPKLLGLAVEHGAASQAISGSAVTFRTTPAKFISALSKARGPDAPLPDDATLRALGRVSLSASFDTTRTAGTDSPNGTALLANYRQLSEAAARIQLWNERDPLHRKNFAAIRALSQDKSAQLFANNAAVFLRAVKKNIEFDASVAETFDKIKAAKTADEINNALLIHAGRLIAIYKAQPGLEKSLIALVDSWVKSSDEHKALYRKIAKAPMLTFEYAFERPPLVKATAATSSNVAPDHHTARLIFAASILDAEYSLTASSTWFHKARPDMSGNFRSAQVGGKIDIPLGELSPLARGVLTFSGLYINLHQRPLGFDLKIQDEKINKPGSIGLFQAKYTIPMSDSGMSVPISFTMSNRTELIKDREIRGNIGLTFDLDKLLR
jgi:hypothetical protein